MIGEHYPLKHMPNFEAFSFRSTGPEGEFIKAIIFEDIQSEQMNTYNLALCVFKDGQLSDKIITNNEDFLKTMYTIAKAIYEFFDAHPDKIVQVTTNEKRRLRIYNGIFQRRYDELKDIFEITGIARNTKEEYSPEKSYTRFELRLKKV